MRFLNLNINKIMTENKVYFASITKKVIHTKQFPIYAKSVKEAQEIFQKEIDREVIGDEELIKIELYLFDDDSN